MPATLLTTLDSNQEHSRSSEDEQDVHNRDAIQENDYQPEPVMHGVGPLFLGVELELETRRDRVDASARCALDWLGDLGVFTCTPCPACRAPVYC